MTERTPMDPFEQRLAGLARAYTAPAARPFDPLATARVAMNTPTGRWAALERATPPAIDRRLVPLLAAAALVTLVVALAVLTGSRPKPPLDTSSRLVFVRDGDLFVSAIDGSAATMIREGGAGTGSLGYLMAVWSPDMESIAAIRDIGGPVLTPAIDIIKSDGTVRRTIDAGLGGTPSVFWSPDSTRLAIATYPAELPRDAPAPVPSMLRLTIAGIDGSSQEVRLPPDAEWLTFAGPDVWTIPDLGIRWSPDGRWITVAWSDLSGKHHVVAADGSGVLASKPAPEGQCRSSRDFVDWFPDGGRLATVGKWASASELCVETIGRDGRPSGPAAIIAATPTDEPGQALRKFMVPAVSPNGDRIAVTTFTDDFERGLHATSLLVNDLTSGQSTEVASGVQKLDATGGSSTWAETLEGDPVWIAGFAWTPDGHRLLYLSPDSSDGQTRWTIRAVDATGGGTASPLVEGVRSFDVGHAP